MAQDENLVILLGRLGDDPEVRYTQSNIAVANLSLATTRNYKDSAGEWQEDTEWHRVVAWDRKAELCQKYLQKGTQVYLKGRLKTRKWEDRDGVERYTTEIVAFNITFLQGTRDPDESPDQKTAPAPDDNVDSDTNIEDKFDDIDDDLPF